MLVLMGGGGRGFCWTCGGGGVNLFVGEGKVSKGVVHYLVWFLGLGRFVLMVHLRVLLVCFVICLTFMESLLVMGCVTMCVFNCCCLFMLYVLLYFDRFLYVYCFLCLLLLL